MKTTHWTWESKAFDVPWRDEPVTIGKANQINNFCIGSQGNENKCMSCHAGYGWEQGREAQQSNPENVDCLACHAQGPRLAGGVTSRPPEAVLEVAGATEQPEVLLSKAQEYETPAGLPPESRRRRPSPDGLSRRLGGDGEGPAPRERSFSSPAPGAHRR